MIDIIVTALRSDFPVDLVLKATLVLGGAGAVALVFHKASAATRHLVWTVSIVGLIMLPLLAYLLPTWEVPIGLGPLPAAVDGESSATAALVEPTAESARPIPIQDEPVNAALGSGDAPVAVAQIAPAYGASSTEPIQWVPVLLGIWALGTALLLLRLLGGWVGIGRLARDAKPVTDPAWGQALKDAAWMLDVDQEVALLSSSRASMPMTWGTLRPTILLPEEASQWPEERRRVVLLHEMAHVTRRDCLTQTLADLACALYWFHPLSWVAARRLRTERERACDDRVLAAGERASDYAGHLLDVARSYRSHRGYGIAAIAMARPSQLEGRLLAVLDGERSRTTPRRRASVMGVGFAALLLLPLSAIRTGEAQLANADDPDGLLAQLQGALGIGAEGVPDEQPAVVASHDESPIGAQMAADTVIDLEIAASPRGTVRLDLETGGNFRLVGWERNTVSVHAELRGRYQEDVTVDLSASNGGVTLSTEYLGRQSNRSGSHTFELRVPTSSNVDFSSSGGSVTIEGVSGAFSGRTGGGDIRLNRVAGRSTLRTGGGDITVTDSELYGDVETGGGNVRITRNRGSLQGRTGGGDVRIENTGARAATGAATAEVISVRTGGGDIELLDLPGGADVSTGGGDIDIRSARGPVTAQTGGGEIWVGSVDGSVDARTGGGDIDIDSAAGSVRLITGSGDVTVAIAAGSGARNVEISSGQGSVTLDLPADFSGDFDVQIDSRGDPEDLFRSDFELIQEVQSGRRSASIRATGRTGNGANRVAIRTSGGEVRIRRITGVAANAGTNRENVQRETRRTARESRPDGKELDLLVEEAVHRGLQVGLDALSLSHFVAAVTDFSLNVASQALDSVAVALQRDNEVEVAREAILEVQREVQREVRIPPRQ